MTLRPSPASRGINCDDQAGKASLRAETPSPSASWKGAGGGSAPSLVGRFKQFGQQTLSPLEPLLGEEHRLGRPARLGDRALFMQPFQGIPVEHFPASSLGMQTQALQGQNASSTFWLSSFMEPLLRGVPSTLREKTFSPPGFRLLSGPVSSAVGHRGNGGATDRPQIRPTPSLSPDSRPIGYPHVSTAIHCLAQRLAVRPAVEVSRSPPGTIADVRKRLGRAPGGLPPDAGRGPGPHGTTSRPVRASPTSVPDPLNAGGDLHSTRRHSPNCAAR